MPYAQEFSNEMGADFLAGEMGDISSEERKQAGLNAQRATAGGLGSIGGLSLANQSAAQNAGNMKNKAISAFNLDVANKQREERMIGEQETFQDTERQRQEAFQKEMSQIDADRRTAAARQQHIWGQQGAVTGAVAQVGADIISRGVGGVMGGGFGGSW
jgi:hypothetical protein